ncbi:hypothetical protein ANOM_004664 [Aspergillus nomiae NRRL 13137]|uniref:Myb-like domain-containing protein n=1 Tax=Aspergillus nomiae NRRL (strain ATCC 15546 / NRRL 13137 / CBS 260.88 / M93) TaxID=1509407 RepID=A0A0L1J5V5_ASPN3|nr:uncharacterized protein ANOM_004664 [Aspergillus nomiae NRRL 13137]KNG86798.1 hypothetical protein ANOM_004664 [Aspergillus nomiae NRRL 13137]
MPLSRGYRTTNERWLTYNAKIRGKATPEASINTGWSAQDDMILQDLRKCNIPWKYISVAMNNKPVEDLKERWLNLREDITKDILAKPRRDTNEVHFIYEMSEDGKVERNVSFSDPLVTNDKADDHPIASQPSKVKHVLYTDENFDLEDVLLLHTIAANWDRDKWLAVSTHFNERTGRSITPDEAKSMINPEVRECHCQWGT